MSFYYINVITIGKYKNVKKMNSEKNIQVQLTLLINTEEAIETLKKSKNKINFFKLYKPANEFLLHKCRNDRKIQNAKKM